MIYKGENPRILSTTALRMLCRHWC